MVLLHGKTNKLTIRLVDLICRNLNHGDAQEEHRFHGMNTVHCEGNILTCVGNYGRCGKKRCMSIMILLRHGLVSWKTQRKPKHIKKPVEKGAMCEWIGGKLLNWLPHNYCIQFRNMALIELQNLQQYQQCPWKVMHLVLDSFQCLVVRC